MRWYWWLIIVVAVGLAVWFAVAQLREANDRSTASAKGNGATTGGGVIAGEGPGEETGLSA